MSWLSSIVSDVGSDLSSFYHKDIVPAAEDVGNFVEQNPLADIGIGAGLLTGGLLLGPELGALFAPAAAAGDITATAGAPLDLAAVAAGGAGDAAATALPFADTAATTGDLSTFLADPGVAGQALNSGLTGNVVSVGGLPVEAAAPIAPSSISAATTAAGGDALTGGSNLGDWLDTTNFGGLTSAPTAVAPSIDATTTAAATGATPLNISPLTAGNNAIDATAVNSAANAANPSLLSQVGSGLSSTGSALKTALPFVGAAGLGYSLYEGYESKQALNQLNQQTQAAAGTEANIAAASQKAAAPLLSQGETLMNYLTTNTLPPQYQTQIQQAIQSQQAAIIQGYGSRGQNTNPAQNSALQQDLNNVQQQAVTMQTEIEQQLATAGNQMVQTANSLLQSGASATQISAQLPIQIAALNAQLNATTAQAIASFAAAMNGSQTVKLVTS